MAISVSRKASNEDIKRLDAAARRFCKKHFPQSVVDDDPECHLSGLDPHDPETKRLRSSWRKSVIRSLSGDGDCIAYGHVGWNQS